MRPITMARIKQLKVNPEGFNTIDLNVLDAIRGKGSITVTKEVITELQEIAKTRNVKDWSWRPPKTTTASEQVYTHWQGPYESRMHRISRTDDVWVCTPPSKFIETEIKNATFIDWWKSNNPESAIVAIRQVEDAQKMDVIQLNYDHPVDQIALLTSIGASLNPVTSEPPQAKVVLYRAEDGRAEIYAPRVGKRKGEAVITDSKIQHVESENVMSDSDTE